MRPRRTESPNLRHLLQLLQWMCCNAAVGAARAAVQRLAAAQQQRLVAVAVAAAVVGGRTEGGGGRLESWRGEAVALADFRTAEAGDPPVHEVESNFDR